MRRKLQVLSLFAGVLFGTTCRVEAWTQDVSDCCRSYQSSGYSLSKAVPGGVSNALGSKSGLKEPDRPAGWATPAPVAMPEGAAAEFPLSLFALALWIGWRRLSGYRTPSSSF